MNNIVSNDAWCYKCGKESMANACRLPPDAVKQIVESKNNNILLNADEYINHSTKNMKIICGSCGEEFITSLSAIVNGDGRCASCGCLVASDLSRTSVEQIIEMATVDGMVMIVDPMQFVDMDTKISFYCSSCGEPFETSPRNYLKREFTRCKECSKRFKSKGEIMISNVLNDHAIHYTTQYIFNDCKDKKVLPFDFYLTDLHKIIEYDGLQHFIPIDYFGGEPAFQTQQLHDKIKNEYCKTNNIPILRIPYWDFDNIEKLIMDFIN